VWNGDILTELDPRVLIDAHRHEATLAVKRRAVGEGNVGVAADGSIVRLRKESIGDPSREASGGEFLGIHVVGAGLRDALPPKGCLVGDVYLPALRRGARLDACFVDVPFVDVGTIAQYLAANAAWLAARGAKSWAAPSAQVGADIEGSVIGANARVDAPALRSVVWPGAHVRAPATDAVVTR
jgi:mannose-1-phosphate guanylyltransferase